MTDRPQRVTADEALAHVDAGMTVASGSLSAEPVVLLEALARRSEEVTGLTLLSGMLLDGYAALTPRLGNEIGFTTWFMPQTLFGDVGFGPHVNFLPMSWVQTYRYVEQLEVDACVVQVAGPDASGNYSFGISSAINKLLVDRARIVIAQVNPAMPFTHGVMVHESELDFVVEHEVPIREFPVKEPGEVEEAIARHVVDLIPDGATVQGGIGTIPETVLRRLAEVGRRNLRITSMITDAGRALIEAGCTVTDGPAAVVGEVLGTNEIYGWVNLEPRVRMVDALETHSLYAINRTSPLVSVNSTLEVDLYGQLNSEVVGKGQAGGIGGSVDFMMGAQFPGNKSVIAMSSTTRRGASKIVPVITRGLVTAPRTLVQFVVTEYGVADLRFLTDRQRTEALIGVAHPDHRDALREAARENGQLAAADPVPVSAN